jgi:hypothetical protein
LRVVASDSCAKEVVMRAVTQHWHVAVVYFGYRDGYEDQPFEDVDSALDYANQTWDTFREDGLQVTEVDNPDDDQAGVIERYRADEGEATVAVVEVRPCHDRGCLGPRPPFRSRSTNAGPTWLNTHEVRRRGRLAAGSRELLRRLP